MKPLILIDFDHTLCNTQKLKHEFPLLPDAVVYVNSLPDNSFDQYLYDDATSFIKYVRLKFQPAIFSEGPLDFQHQKIDKSSISALIPPPWQFIYPPDQKNDHLAPLLQTHSILALIDDKPGAIATGIKSGLFSIRVVRGEHEHQPDLVPPTASVHSLHQIIDQDLLSKLPLPGSS